MKKKDIVFFSVVVAIFLGAIAVLFSSGTTFTPVIVALILAFLLDPLVAFLEKKRVNRTLSIILVFFTFVLLLAILGTTLVFSFRQEFQGVQVNLPAYADRAYQLIPAQVKTYLHIETPDKLYQQINQGLEQLRGVSLDVAREALTVVKKAFTSTLAFILTLLGYVITPIYLYYFLKDMPRMRNGMFEVVPHRYREGFRARASEINDLLTSFVRGQLAVCGILAVLYSVGLYIIGIDLALIIGTLSGILFIIPYFGFIFGITLSMLMAVLKFHDVLHPSLCLGWFLLVQGLEGSVITPRIVGHKVGLHPVVTIVAVILGGEYFGILGMLLAVPVTAVLKVFFRVLFDYYRHTPYYTGS